MIPKHARTVRIGLIRLAREELVELVVVKSKDGLGVHPAHVLGSLRIACLHRFHEDVIKCMLECGLRSWVHGRRGGQIGGDGPCGVGGSVPIRLRRAGGASTRMTQAGPRGGRSLDARAQAKSRSTALPTRPSDTGDRVGTAEEVGRHTLSMRPSDLPSLASAFCAISRASFDGVLSPMLLNEAVSGVLLVAFLSTRSTTKLICSTLMWPSVLSRASTWAADAAGHVRHGERSLWGDTWRYGEMRGDGRGAPPPC